MAQNAIWAPWSAPHLPSARHPKAAAALQRARQAVRGWCFDHPKPLDVQAEAVRLMESWGALASDIALARSSRASAGFFDEPHADFSKEVSLEIHRGRDLSDQTRPSTGSGRL